MTNEKTPRIEDFPIDAYVDVLGNLSEAAHRGGLVRLGAVLDEAARTAPIELASLLEVRRLNETARSNVVYFKREED